jgi:hypothetical protein
MSANKHFSYIKLIQCVRIETEMGTVVAQNCYYILRTQSRIQQTRFHCFR